MDFIPLACIFLNRERLDIIEQVNHRETSRLYAKKERERSSKFFYHLIIFSLIKGTTRT